MSELNTTTATASKPARADKPSANPGRVVAHPATDETVKETIESIVIAFILAFMFRAFVVEAFIIPTGSMAPTLLGAHVSVTCPCCGYAFDVSLSPEHKQGQVLGGSGDPVEVACPMCRYPVVIAPGSRVSAGDRILVDKFIYTFQDPRRWDVIVFKNPQGSSEFSGSASSQETRTNYIKRLVGLPGERVILLDGNIYVASEDDPDSFRIARKTDPQANPHWDKIQRAVWQPIYHSQYAPLTDARAWDGAQGDPNRGPENAWSPPWHAERGDEAKWQLGTAVRPSREYRFLGGTGAIQFDFFPRNPSVRHDGYRDTISMFNYNRGSSGRDKVARESDLPIEDIRLSASVIPEGENMLISLSTTARLDRPDLGVETLVASVDSKGYVYLTVPMDDGSIRELAPVTRGPALRPGVATQVELWVVDDQISVWVAGEMVVRRSINLDWEQVRRRGDQDTLPKIKIQVDSPEPATLVRVELDRDIYYSDRFSTKIQTVERDFNGIVQGSNPVQLRTQTDSYDDEYFVLGDNTPSSQDGREWRTVNGWVTERNFGGVFRPNVVPRGLLVGRAFYVYYPAPHPISFGDKGIIPNFGTMRFIH
ncbi:MAG: signal peptidase I [Planctomycetota bacterium]